jgi:hypothetical protein
MRILQNLFVPPANSQEIQIVRHVVVVFQFIVVDHDHHGGRGRRRRE